ncbi:MAG: DUF6273 domain-containing protein [Clostridiales bacterium]|jgi:hypothetical protein|nr:DUF6273 domain-containing protein [Clostridiales bacterium]
MQIGDKIVFGEYEWRVLDIQGDNTLIITEYIIEQRSYNDANKDITWADCSLRKYLNGEFYEKFSEAEKSKILSVEIKNENNQWYGTNCGEDTNDKIFLLSIEEVSCKYFGDSSSLLYSPKKNQIYWFEKKDVNNEKRIARYEGESWGSWWWLRSMGRNNIKAVYIHGNGDIGIQGNNAFYGNKSDGKCCGGVRPTLWTKMKITMENTKSTNRIS